MNKQTRIIRGCWQLAEGHYSQTKPTIEPILDAIDCGFTTFDCADIYSGVEGLLGKAAKRHPQKTLRIHTKFVPDLDCLDKISREYVASIIERSLKRLQVKCLDLVQFHWWDWEIKNYLLVMEYLFELKTKGKIVEVGLTNVNRKYLEKFLKHFEIASLQAQVSLFDKRIEKGVGELCQKNKIKIFAYGSLLGGFINEKWLGQPEPALKELANRSLVKYKLLIDAACGWEEFQRRLFILKELAIKYRCDIATLAIAALLQGNKVDAVIVGLSPQNFLVQNRSLAHLPLIKSQDLNEITTWPCHLSGDVYDEERNVNGTHAQIMKYNLNARRRL